jgi:ATP-dependent helicase/nuclease subunit A
MTSWTKEQLEAINTKGTNIIVSAGAGSGKTAVLTERVITKLLNGTHINELLILTFTNNAALEMKMRIKDAIKENDSIKNELKLIDSASITTFDAYVLSLVKKYHYCLNLDSNISIIESSIINEKKKEFINKIFDDYYEKNDELFNNFAVNFGTKNDKNLRSLILELDNKIDLLTNKEEYLKNYINDYYSPENINYLFNEYEKTLIKRTLSIKGALYNLSFEVDSNYYEKINNLLLPLINAKTYDEIRNNLVDLGKFRLPNNSSDEAKHYKSQIVNIISKLKDLVLFNKDVLLEDLSKTKDYAQIIIKILILLNQKTLDYKHSINMYEFNDISKMAINLLNNNPDVCGELKNYYKEIMIDEYQDTSDIEEQFINLIENNNVYMVGDIKQSIYRFRNANPDIFKLKYDKYKNNNGGIKIDLNKNFRSRENVLDSINNIFNHIMDSNIGNADYKKEHKLIFGNLLYNLKGNNNYNNDLEILNYEIDNKHVNEEIEAFIIGNDILKKVKERYLVFDKELRPCTYKDFCILMDRTTVFETYRKVFNYLKIPLNVFKDDDILLSDETYLIKNILGLIINIKNKIFNETTKFYYTSIARSYLYNEEDNIIYQNIMNNEINSTEIYLKCLEVSKLLDIKSNKEIIEEIVNSFDFYQKIIAKGEINHRTIIINNLIQKAKDLNEIGTDIYGVADYLNSLIDDGESIKITASNSDSNSVTITNIHKSKGLEYKICYYSGLYKLFNMQDIKKKITFTNNYGLILPSYENGFKSTFVNYLYKEKYVEEEISEKLRLFYVALTRAKEKMIIVTSLKNDLLSNTNEDDVIDYLDRINIKSFQDILNLSYNYINKYVKDIDLPLIDDNYNISKDFNIKDYINNDEKVIVNEIENSSELLTEEHYSKATKRLYTKEEKDNMLYGTKIHYVLENTNLKNPDYSLLNNDEKDIVKSLLSNELMKNIQDGKIYQEYEFVFEKDNSIKTGIIDLMIEYDNHIDIIDYKLKHVDDEAYIKQLNGYKEFIENKTKKKTNIYLYSLLDKKIVSLN